MVAPLISFLALVVRNSAPAIFGTPYLRRHELAPLPVINRSFRRTVMVIAVAMEGSTILNSREGLG
jgi:hypothetical protein